METDRYQILVPIDGSDLSIQAIPWALTIAGDDGVVLLFAANDVASPLEGVRDWIVGITEQDQERADIGARQHLEQLGERALSGLDHWRVEIAQGAADEEIVRAASEDGSNLIAMASHGRGALGRWRYGSVADRVVQTSTTPVLLVRPGDEPVIASELASISRFVVALDGSERSEQTIPVVAELAKRTDTPVHLVSVLGEPDLLLGAPWMGPPEGMDERRSAFASVRDDISEHMSSLVAGLEAQEIEASWTIQVGDPYEEIERLTGDEDVIAITTHGRSGLERWALGSLADKFVRHSSSPVLIVNARASSGA